MRVFATSGKVAALMLAACSPTFGSAPEREVIVVPQGTTVVPAR